jgi:glycosyltransferase involved in cell wall biosynthesis
MPRGVDCEEFHPRFRQATDGLLRLGFVGRVTPEKGVRLLAEIERALLRAGHRDFLVLVVGQGSEVEWLKEHMRHADFRGVLRGRDLASAFADMDLFVFPSRTDTFGNVIQEAAASGVGSLVTGEGGPRNLVVPGVTGFVAGTDQQFIAKAVELASDRERLRRMGQAAREHVLGVSWDSAFRLTYAAYLHCRDHQPFASFPRRPTFPTIPGLPAAV